MSILSNTLELNQVELRIDQQQILAPLNLDLVSETIYTVLGPSGTGKSSLLRVIAGLVAPTSGQLTYDGEVYVANEHVIGLVPQNYGLLPWQTAQEAVISAMKLSLGKKKLLPIELDEVNHLFKQMAIESLKGKYPHEMSGGQQQRVSITRAFAVKADFLLMDEPFSALDAFTREKAQQLFLDTWTDDPKTTLFITHDIEEAVLLGQKIILMAGQPGQIVRVLDNPLAQGEKNLTSIREGDEFYQQVRQLRKELKQNETIS